MRLRNLFSLAFLVIVIAIITYIADPNWPGRLIYPLAHRDIIVEKAEKNSVSPSLVAAIIYQESRFDRRARSEKGAVGLMQLLPSTAEWVASKNGEETGDLHDPERNIELGTEYLRYLIHKYHDQRLALAAYNGGETNINRVVEERKDRSTSEVIAAIPFRETRDYVRNVTLTQERYQDYYGLK